MNGMATTCIRRKGTMYDTVSDSCVNSIANWYAQISKTAKHSMANPNEMMQPHLNT